MFKLAVKGEKALMYNICPFLCRLQALLISSNKKIILKSQPEEVSRVSGSNQPIQAVPNILLSLAKSPRSSLSSTVSGNNNALVDLCRPLDPSMTTEVRQLMKLSLLYMDSVV